MQTLTFEMRGLSPLLMHADRLANPLDPLTKEMKSITSKKKTDDDLHAIAKLEWMCGLYYAAGIGPYLPGANLERCLRDAARMNKLGRNVERGLTVEQERVQLDYSGPRDAETLWADPQFIDQRMVKVQKQRVMRTRPIFRDWSATFSIILDETQLDPRQVVDILHLAGRYVGLGDWRPRFGRFEVTGTA